MARLAAGDLRFEDGVVRIGAGEEQSAGAGLERGWQEDANHPRGGWRAVDCRLSAPRGGDHGSQIERAPLRDVAWNHEGEEQAPGGADAGGIGRGCDAEVADIEDVLAAGAKSRDPRAGRGRAGGQAQERSESVLRNLQGNQMPIVLIDAE